jgi:hypothetical protein
VIASNCPSGIRAGSGSESSWINSCKSPIENGKEMNNVKKWQNIEQNNDKLRKMLQIKFLAVGI